MNSVLERLRLASDSVERGAGVTASAANRLAWLAMLCSISSNEAAPINCAKISATRWLLVVKLRMVVKLRTLAACAGSALNSTNRSHGTCRSS